MQHILLLGSLATLKWREIENINLLNNKHSKKVITRLIKDSSRIV